MPGHQASHAAPSGLDEGDSGKRPGQPLSNLGRRGARAEPLEVGRRQEQVPGQRLAGGLHQLSIEGEEVELVAGLHQSEELVLGRDLAMRAPAVAGPRPGKPRSGQRGEGAGIEPAEQHLVGGVVARRPEGPERRVDGHPHRRIPGDIAVGLGAVAHEARGVGQEETAPADDR